MGKCLRSVALFTLASAGMFLTAEGWARAEETCSSGGPGTWSNVIKLCGDGRGNLTLRKTGDGAFKASAIVTVYNDDRAQRGSTYENGGTSVPLGNYPEGCYSAHLKSSLGGDAWTGRYCVEEWHDCDTFFCQFLDAWNQDTHLNGPFGP